MCRQFYRVYPIANALRSQLSWTQYRTLIQIPDPDKREYYELEAVNEGWTGLQLERQINAMLYERLLMSNDKEKVLAFARNERQPESPNSLSLILTRSSDLLDSRIRKNAESVGLCFIQL